MYSFYGGILIAYLLAMISVMSRALISPRSQQLVSFRRRLSVSSSSRTDWEKWKYGVFKYGNDTHVEPTPLEIERLFERLENESNDRKKEAALWSRLSANEVAFGVSVLQQYCSAKRFERFQKVASQRTNHIRMMFESPANANNLFATLRTLDSFSVQNVDIVLSRETYLRQPWRCEQMGASLGSNKWLTLREHESSEACLQSLKNEGFRIVSTDLHSPNAVSAFDFDWNAAPTAVIFGNEEAGVSEIAKSLSDNSVYIPMSGFCESLNLSASVAVFSTLLQMKGALKPNLSEEDQKRLQLTWLVKSIGSRSSLPLLERAGLPVSPKQGIYENMLPNQIPSGGVHFRN